MSDLANKIEAVRRRYVDALGTPLEAAMRKRLEWLVQEARAAK